MNVIHKKRIRLFSVFLAAAALLMAFLLYTGVILFNNPSREIYPVWGVDVSHHQGKIDWDTLARQDIQFAYIKATEGSNFKDKNFQENFFSASRAGLRVGAYHFFSYYSSGESQYMNFISVVPLQQGMLPPVVDIEFYGAKKEHPPDRQQTKKELRILLRRLEGHYGTKALIYTTDKAYRLYIADDFYDNDIWIRSVFTEPALTDKRRWKFWQYTNREKLAGYQGREEYIDVNVFAGTEREFAAYPERPSAMP